jgi:hypothetical protein
MAFKSFRDSEGEIDIGRHLPGMIEQQGLELASTRTMSKLVRPGTLAWHWPTSFYQVYFPKLVANGLLEEATCTTALQQWAQLTNTPGATCLCPQMTEVIARKPE